MAYGLSIDKNGELSGKGNYNESKGEKLGSSGIPSDNRVGLWRFWYENGQLKAEGNYVNGKSEGFIDVGTKMDN